MAAVDDLLGHLRSMDHAVDLISSNPSTDPDFRDHVARGVAVHGLACIEMFFTARISEWSHALTVARIAPGQLPGGTKPFEDRVVEVLPRILKDTDGSGRSGLLRDVGYALTSLSSGTLIVHPLAMRWPKSNISIADIETMVSFFGVERQKVWGELTAVWKKIDPSFPGNTGLKSLFEAVAVLRHEAAHAPSPNIPIPNLLTVTRDIRRICVCVDAIASHGLTIIRRGTTTGKPIAVHGSNIKIRRIIQDGKIWPEYSPQVNRAKKRHATLQSAMSAANLAARRNEELVLAWNDSGEIVDWSFPAL